MILYFSGARNYLSEQSDVNQSLGGYMSKTPIPNSRLNALFDDLSSYNLREKVDQTLAFFLYNETDADVLNISIENVYQKVLGENVNLCDFEFSVVEPTEEGFIEQIGSKNEEPFYVDWFTCESKCESVKVKILTQANIGEEISILGNVGIVSELGIIESTNKLFELAMRNSDFIVERFSDDTIMITRKNLGITGQSIGFTTNGVMTIDNNNLSGGLNGSVLVVEEIKSKKAIGVWVKRKINNNYKTLQSSDCFPTNLDIQLKKETLELIFNFSID